MPSASVTVPVGYSFMNPSGYSTTSFNASAATTNLPNIDYSDEQLNFLWDQVRFPPRLQICRRNIDKHRRRLGRYRLVKAIMDRIHLKVLNIIRRTRDDHS